MNALWSVRRIHIRVKTQINSNALVIGIVKNHKLFEKN